MPRCFVSFVLLCALAGSAFAQEVGDNVVVKADHVALRPEKGPAAMLAKGEIVIILKVEKNRFFARLAQGRDHESEGWINRSEVLTLSSGLDAFRDELKRQPTANAYATRGRIWAALHEYDKALADYDEAIRRDPKQTWAYADRAIARFAKREYDQSVSDLTEAIRLDPKFATAYVRRAYSWRAKDQLDKALADCDEALRINPSFAAAHVAKSAIWCSQRKYGLALGECNEAIRLDPNFAMVYAARAYAWQLKLDYGKAISDYDAAIRLDPKIAKWFVARGMAYGAMEDFDGALGDYDAAIRLDLKESQPLVLRAWLTATCPDPRIRNGKKSLKDAKKACELTDWKDGASLGALAAAYAENGDFLNAVKWQKKAIDLVPQNQKRQQSILRYRLTLYQSQRPYHEKRRGE